MDDSFGARLRRHRESRGVSVAEIAEKTKIKASLLDGLERDDISQWPGGIFRRAYVRTYATAIGFDPDAAVREFLELHPDPIEVPDQPASQGSGLRGLFGSLRRRSAAPISIAPQAATGVTATVGKRAADQPADLALPAPERVPVTENRLFDGGPARPAAAAEPEASSAAPGTEEVPPARPRSPEASFRTQDLLEAARICTELGRVEDVDQVSPLLRDAATLLAARGLIVWVWDATAEELRPVLVHGYTPKVRSRLRGVRAEADNVTAAAYRAGAPLARSGALAVPLLVPSACTGVLAIEVADGREQDPQVCVIATFFAAMLAQLVGTPAAETRAADTPADAPAAGHAAARPS